MEATQETYRCRAADGCDESTIERYLVVNRQDHVSRADYCTDCAELARVDWNGETAELIGPFGSAEAREDALCQGCSETLGEPVLVENCSTLTHPMKPKEG